MTFDGSVKSHRDLDTLGVGGGLSATPDWLASLVALLSPGTKAWPVLSGS
jgi:hypothetical protein